MIKSPPFSISLESERFELRTLKPNDASDRMLGWIMDPLAAEMLNASPKLWTLDDQKDYFRSYYGKSNKLLLGIITKSEGHCIGLYIVSFSKDAGVFTVSTLIGDVEWRGKDAATEASIAVERYFFEDLGFWKMKANVRTQNKAMQWVLLTNGWRKEAHLKQHIYVSDDKPRGDIYIFGLLASEWRDLIGKRTQPNA